MSHNDHLRPDGFPTAAFVQCPLVITPADMQLLDYLSTRSINGDDGGEWDPTSPICIGGAGLHTTTSTTGIFGGVETRSDGRMVLGTNDFPYFFDPITTSSTRARDVVVPVCNSLGGNNDAANAASFGLFGNGDVWMPATQSVVPASGRGSIAICIDPWVHQGAHLMSARLGFRVPFVPSNVVTNQIECGVSRVLNDGTIDIVLIGAISPSSPDAFYASGVAQTLDLTLQYADGTNNVINRATTNYFFNIDYTEGAGTTARAIFHALRLSMTQITDMRFQ